MKKILLILSFSLMLFANDSIINKDSCMSQPITSNNELISKNIVDTQKRGCCSWHGGVNGCKNGRVVCADGTYSPSCTCLGGMPISSDDKIN